MVTSELRLGNWVLSLGRDGVWYNSRVSNLTQEEIIIGVGFKRDVKPIPLSEEILLKCGFDKEVQDYNGFSVIIFRLKGWLPFLKEMKLQEAKWYQVYHVADCHISELHQLQNLYFALTGQELNVKL